MENSKKIGNYSIGLDLGSTSVGWAVINDNFDIVKRSGKRLYGTRLFDEGQPAGDRRMKRSARRRLERRRERVRLLRELMADDVLKQDESFYIRMDESMLKHGDEFGRRSKYNLFDGSGLTDKEFYKKYKTIYHLRRDLMENPEKADIRAVYLAIHHIVKYRGNFLYESDIEAECGYSDGLIAETIKNYTDTDANNFYPRFVSSVLDEFEKIVIDKSLKYFDKLKRIAALSTDKQSAAVLKETTAALLGNKFDVLKLIASDEEDESETASKITFADETADDEIAEILEKYGEQASIVSELKTIYSKLILREIMESHTFVSEAMTARYDTHADDLKLVKRLMKKYVLPVSREEYKAFFTAFPKSKESICYFNYLKHPSKMKEKGKNDNKTDAERITKKIKDLLERYGDEEALKADADYIKLSETIKERTLLPKINLKSNGEIPYQLHLNEINRILENQGEYYPTLKENADKIRRLLTFRRPYYVGVLNPESPFNWYDKRIEGRVYPWNFEEKVEYEYAEEKFISKLTNYCSVFKDMHVLPKNSFLYSEYVVLDELNAIKIGGRRIDQKVKEAVYRDLFCSEAAKAEVKAKDIAEYINAFGLVPSVSADDITGFRDEGKFANVLKSRRDFRRKLGSKFSEAHIGLYEKAVFTNTVFSDVKTRIKRLSNIFKAQIESGEYTEKDIKNIASLNYSGWGRFSEKLLDGIYAETASGKRSVIELMRGDTLTLSEIRWDKRFGLSEIMNPTPQMERGKPSELYDRLILPAYCSPAVKKSIYEAVKVVDEIVRITGADPQKIYIEWASGEEDASKKGARIPSRLLQLIRTIKSSLKNNRDLKDNEDLTNALSKLEELEAEKKYDALSDTKLFLWHSQLGKCMYTGKDISLSDLYDKKACEIDHIIPRSLIKDDSLENRVLVLRDANQYKADHNVLDRETIKKMAPFWKMLKKSKLIGAKKYTNLTRSEWHDEDIEGFIARQLVETRQTVKEAAKIFEQVYGNASQTASEHVVSAVNAGLSEDFKKAVGYYKIRELNDRHHAKDAYIAAVIGQFTDRTVKMNIREYRNTRFLNAAAARTQTQSDKKLLYGVIVDMMTLNFRAEETVSCDESGRTETRGRITEGGEVVWDDEILDKVKANLAKNDCFISKKIEKVACAQFYNQNYSEAKANLSPKFFRMTPSGEKKALPPASYGGYDSKNDKYAVVAEFTEKRKKKVAIIGIPAVVAANNREKEYLKDITKDPLVVEKLKIYRNQLIDYNGHLCYFVSATELKSAVQLNDNYIYAEEIGSDTTAYPGWQQSVAAVMRAAKKKKKLDESMRDKVVPGLKRFIEHIIENLYSERFPLYRALGEKLKDFYVKGGFDALPFAEAKDSQTRGDQQIFIKKLLSAVRGGCENLSEIVAEVDGEKVCVKDSSAGRYQRPNLSVKDLTVINRSVTGFWEEKKKI